MLSTQGSPAEYLKAVEAIAFGPIFFYQSLL